MAQPAACAACATELIVPSPPHGNDGSTLGNGRHSSLSCDACKFLGAGSNSPVLPAALSASSIAWRVVSGSLLPEAALMMNSSGEAGSISGPRDSFDSEGVKQVVRGVDIAVNLLGYRRGDKLSSVIVWERFTVAPILNYNITTGRSTNGLVIGRHDIPWWMPGAGRMQAGLICLHISRVPL